ncbi:MAG: AtpZ/AtpI family protein [Planctomycetota bacterium]|nr:MAG: AtpZ/AtpI family protein [Planctomycetota bacterium]
MPDHTPPTPEETPAHGGPPPPAEDPRLAIPDVLRESPAERAARLGGAEPDGRRPASAMVETARAWGMALDLVFSTLGMFALGYLFDLWRGTGPWGAAGRPGARVCHLGGAAGADDHAPGGPKAGPEAVGGPDPRAPGRARPTGPSGGGRAPAGGAATPPIPCRPSPGCLWFAPLSGAGRASDLWPP